MEDPLARTHRLYQEWCIEQGTYRPFTAAELDKEINRWKAKCKEVNPNAKPRKKPPKGTAD